YALGAFLVWGGFPLYFKLVAAVPATEVLGHRVLWSLLAVALLLAVRRDWRGVARALADRALLRRLALSALLVSVNWLVFIWAVAHDHVLDASLGYFINPLVNVLLGVLVLHERLRPAQWLAIALAAVAVGNLVWQHGSLPWIALTLALTFGCYGLVRKQLPVDPFSALCVETLLLVPLALPFVLLLELTGEGHFLDGGVAGAGLLVLAGVLTALPLLLFGGAAQRLRLSTLGLLQYMVPTMHLLLAVLLFGEAFTAVHAVTFGILWAGLAVYSVDHLARR
ncbi:MAG TPA: EamA family transporter RarD, partial [Gammaproteobacteria bacterium]